MVRLQGSRRLWSVAVAGVLSGWLALGSAQGTPHPPSAAPRHAALTEPPQRTLSRATPGPPRQAPPAASGSLSRAQEATLAHLDSLEAAGALDSLLSVLYAALPAAREVADSAFLMNLLVRQGRSLASVGRGMEAEPPLREALRLAERLAHPPARCASLHWLAASLERQGRREEARAQWQRLLSLSLSLGDREHEGWARFGLGFADWCAGRSDLALPAYQRAAILFAEQGQFRGQAQALCGLGCVYSDFGRNDEAVDCFRRTIEIGRSNGWPGVEALGANDLACLLYAVGDPGEAQRYFRRAHELQVLTGNHREALIAGTNQALCQGFLGQYEDALRILAPLAEQCRRYGILELEGTILNLTAEIRLLQGRPHLAAELSRSLIATGKSLSPGQRMEALMGLSRALSEADSNQSALEVLQAELPWVQTLHPDLVVTRFGIDLGRRQLDVGQARAALETLSAAHAHAVRLSFSGLRLRSLSLLARAHRALGQPDTSLALLEEATDLWDQERGLPADPQWREARGAITRDLRTQLALLLLSHPPHVAPEDRARAAFDALQVFKARTLQERMQGPGAKTPTEPDLHVATCRELREEILDPGELLLDFHLGVDSSLVIAVWRSGIRAVRLPPSPALEPALRFYREQLSTPPEKPWSTEQQRVFVRACRETRQLLLGGLLDLIAQASALIISADGEVNLIPFSALLLTGDPPDPEARPLPLIQCVPSATILEQLRRTRAHPAAVAVEPGSILALAGATSGTGRRLRGAQSEVEDLAARFAGVCRALPSPAGGPPSRGQPTNVEATLDSLARPVAVAAIDRSLIGLLDQLSPFEVLHIAAHSQVDDQNPWRSAIELGDSTTAGGATRLPAHAIAGHKLGARLVVLSGCESAGGRVLSGEGVLGLSSAFLSAGVPTVLATLWAVEDRSAAKLMRAFYAQLAEGSSPAQALAAAQVSLRRERRTAHPFYWAGFVLLGDGSSRPGLRSREGGVGADRLLLMALGVTAAVVVAWLARRLAARASVIR